MKEMKSSTRHFFISLYAILVKNFKTVFRSKSSAFTIILGPLLVMSLIILAFNNSSFYDIHIGTHSESYSKLSNQVLTSLENKGYVVTRADNLTECIDGVKSSQFNVCLVFSKDMQVSNKAKNNIDFYVDPGRINIVHNIMASVNKEILQTSTNVSLELTNILLNKLSSTRDELNNRLEIISTLNSNNGRIKESANNLRSKAGAVDLAVLYDDFKISDLSKEISRVNSSYNISTADNKAINDKIIVIDTQINATISKLSSAKSKLNEISDGILFFPDMAENNIKQVNSLKDSIDKIIASINSIEVTDPEQIVSPIKTNVQTVESQETHIGKLLPTFLVLIIMFVCILLSSSLILTERTSSAYLRNAITSTPSSVFLMGAYLTSLIVIIFHIILISFILNIILGYNLVFLLPAVLPLFLIVSMFIMLGIIIGYISNSQETSSVISLAIITIVIFLSNTILPLETLPLRLKEFILYNPFVISEALLKRILIFEFGLEKVLDHILRLLWYNLALIIIGYLCLKFSRPAIKR